MAYRILGSAPVQLVLIGFLNWVGLGWDWVRGFGEKVLGTGLDNKMKTFTVFPKVNAFKFKHIYINGHGPTVSFIKLCLVYFINN